MQRISRAPVLSATLQPCLVLDHRARSRTSTSAPALGRATAGGSRPRARGRPRGPRCSRRARAACSSCARSSCSGGGGARCRSRTVIVFSALSETTMPWRTRRLPSVGACTGASGSGAGAAARPLGGFRAFLQAARAAAHGLAFALGVALGLALLGRARRTRLAGVLRARAAAALLRREHLLGLGRARRCGRRLGGVRAAVGLSRGRRPRRAPRPRARRAQRPRAPAASAGVVGRLVRLARLPCLPSSFQSAASRSPRRRQLALARDVSARARSRLARPQAGRVVELAGGVREAQAEQLFAQLARCARRARGRPCRAGPSPS